MLMTSNFPVKLRHIKVLLLILFFVFAAVSCCCITAAPDSPRPYRVLPPRVKPPSLDNTQLRTPVELKSVSVRKIDKEMEKFAGKKFLDKAANPLLIKVQVAIPIDPTPWACFPAIVLNGKKLVKTWVLSDSRDILAAFLPDRSSIKKENTVAVVWVGSEEMTLTRHPLIFKEEDID